ncbi:MAG TPA: hypothetical protein PLN52_05245 [Opitutaceae bacterium]|nr:hypothetical protein [Opitutaceae bacterium]
MKIFIRSAAQLSLVGFGLTNWVHGQMTSPVDVSETGYTLFFLGFALVGLALFNLRRRV